MQIGHGDTKETTRQLKQLARKRKEEESRDLKIMKDQSREKVEREALATFLEEEAKSLSLSTNDITPLNNNQSNNNDEDYIGEREKNKNYNTMRLTNVARESLRWNVSVRATAAITSAAFIDCGFVDEENAQFLVDRQKIQREREKLIKEFREEGVDNIDSSTVDCIFFDGRRDMTKVKLVNESGKKFPSTQWEEHYLSLIHI